MADTRLTARMLTLNAAGEPHHEGQVVVVDDTHAYLVGVGGTFRRVQVLEQTAEGVRYRQIRAATKAEKKALKRERQRARADLAAAAVRVARRALASQEAHA